jgi:hypothetical protein
MATPIASYETLLRDNGPCLSILMPIDASEDRAHGGRSRLRKLLRMAAHRAESNGLSLNDSAAVLGPWEVLMDQSGFWKGTGKGLALLSSPHATAALWLSEPVQEGLRLARSFDVLPLLRLRDRRPFHILVLSHARLRLIRWDGTSAAVVELPGMPTSVEQALGAAQPRELQFHGTGRQRRRIGHGGESGQDDKQDLRTYFHRVEAALRPYLERAGGGPWVLAGVQYMQSMYRELTRTPGLLPDGLLGNCDRVGAERLCAQARPVLAAQAEAAWRQDLARFVELGGHGRTSTDPVELHRLALLGNVLVLFLRDPGAVEALEEALESAAVEVLRKGGVVHLVPPDDMPGRAAGILRHATGSTNGGGR